MNQVKFSWKPAFKNFEVIRSAKTDHIISDVKILFKFSFFQFLSSDQWFKIAFNSFMTEAAII